MSKKYIVNLNLVKSNIDGKVHGGYPVSEDVKITVQLAIAERLERIAEIMAEMLKDGR